MTREKAMEKFLKHQAAEKELLTAAREAFGPDASLWDAEKAGWQSAKDLEQSRLELFELEDDLGFEFPWEEKNENY